MQLVRGLLVRGSKVWDGIWTWGSLARWKGRERLRDDSKAEVSTHVEILSWWTNVPRTSSWTEHLLLYKTGKQTTFLSMITLHFSVSSPKATWEYPSHPVPGLPFLQGATWQFMRCCLKNATFIQLFSFFKQLSHVCLVNAYDTHTVSNVSTRS